MNQKKIWRKVRFGYGIEAGKWYVFRRDTQFVNSQRKQQTKRGCPTIRFVSAVSQFHGGSCQLATHSIEDVLYYPLEIKKSFKGKIDILKWPFFTHFAEVNEKERMMVSRKIAKRIQQSNVMRGILKNMPISNTKGHADYEILNPLRKLVLSKPCQTFLSEINPESN